MRMWCWHDWTKWKTYRLDGVHQPFCKDAQVAHFSRTLQARICTKCGKEIHRRVEDAIGNRYEDINSNSPDAAGPNEERQA